MVYEIHKIQKTVFYIFHTLVDKDKSEYKGSFKGGCNGILPS